MRVLQVSKYYYPVIGGVESHLKLLSEGISKNIEVKVLVSNIKPRTEVERSNNLEIIRIASIGRVFSMPISPTFPLWMGKIKADILHFHHPFPWGMVSYFLTSRINATAIKTIVTYHSDIVRQKITGELFKPILNRFLKRADCIIATSPNLIEDSSILKNYRNKCRIIPLGIDIEKFKNRGGEKEIQSIRDKYGRKIVLFVGRLIYYKGLEYLIRAAPEVNAHFILIGEGPLEKILKQKVSSLNVEKKITFLKSMDEDELILYYYACDLFVLPSIAKSEAFGLVQLESMACGKPVVSTNLPTGVPFVNLHKHTGLIVPPEDSKALARAINTLLENQSLRREYGENARKRVEEEFTKEKMIERTLKLYDELMRTK